MSSDQIDLATNRNVNQETIREMAQRKQVAYKLKIKCLIQLKKKLLIELGTRIKQSRRSFQTIGRKKI